ncbi:MAG: hypothetical protein P9X24_19060 [Candidatus Hatepunaea meridiana]|nr:hypothetical protein [Candidatus Hatepunaea meridiana]
MSFIKWVSEGPGYIVYGGTRYFEELSQGGLGFINALKDYRYSSVVVLRDEIIDSKQSEVCSKYPDAFDLDNEKNDGDPHIVAICLVSKTKIVCTNDKGCKRAIKSVFTKNRPRLYSSDKNADLLRPDNAIKIPLSKIKK